MNLLLLLLLQDYFKNMDTAKTTQNKEKKKITGSMGWREQTIESVDFEIRLAPCEFKESRKKSRGGSERGSGSSQTSGEDTA